MKNLILTALILLAAFSKVTAQANVSKGTAVNANAKLIKAEFLYGEWTRCAITWKEHKRISKSKFADTEHEVTANVCPVIVFNADFTGYFKLADLSLKHFKWQLQTNKLAISSSDSENKGDGPFRILKDGIYKVVAHSEELHYNKIVLIDSQGVSHILGK